MRCLLVSGLLLPLLVYGQWTPSATGDVASRALGGNGVAAQSSQALWRNPAGYAEASVPELFAGVEWRYGLDELRVANLGLLLPGGWGIGLTHFGLEGFAESRLEVGYGRRLGKRWTVGLTTIGLRQRPPQQVARHFFTAGGGVQYVPTSSVTLGIATTNPMGRGDLPSRIALGGSYRPTESVGLSAEWRRRAGKDRFGGGLAYRPVAKLEVLLGLVTGPSEASLGVRYAFGRQLRVAGVSAYHTALGSSPAFGLWYDLKDQEPGAGNPVN